MTEEEGMKLKIDSLDGEVEYLLKMTKEGDHIHFMLRECNLFPPFTFEGDYTMKDFISKHVAFKSCDNLDELLEHLSNLYKQNKIELSNLGGNEELQLRLTIWDISVEEKTEPFIVELKMTENKDEDLAKLYEIQNTQVEILKQIKEYVKKNMENQNPISKKILELLKDCPIEL